MKIRQVPRVTGVLMLAAAGGTTLLHRAEYEAARHGPAQLAEFALGLLTFMLASTGILLLIQGARLFERDGAASRWRQPQKGHPGRHGAVEAPCTQSRAAVLMQSRRIVTAVYGGAGHEREPWRSAMPSRLDKDAGGWCAGPVRSGKRRKL